MSVTTLPPVTGVAWLHPPRLAAIADDAYRLAAWRSRCHPDDGLSERTMREQFAEDVASSFQALLIGEALRYGCWSTWTHGKQDAAMAQRALADVPAGWMP